MNSQKIEQTLGSLKFAVIVITAFAFAMIIGTFLESYFGTDFANRTVYKTPIFMLIQFGMFVSITFAALLRLPPKKRLYGFYTIHSGLVILGAGSFITYYAGVDGHLLLPPNSPAREVVLSDDQLKIHYPDEGRVVSLNLPYSAFPKEINESYEDIKVLSFYPFSDKVFEWQKPQQEYPDSQTSHSAIYTIANPNIAQEFTLTLHPEAIDFKNNVSMGPLTVHYLPDGLKRCFGKNDPSKFIFWDRRTNLCFTPEEKKLSIQKTSKGKRFIVLRDKERVYSFFPDLNPWPMNEKFEIDQSAPIRVFSKALFEKRPNLFLFGKSIAFYQKEEETWVSSTLEKLKPIDLPWMGFELTLKEFESTRVPSKVPKYQTPIQKNGSLVRGATKAVHIKVQDKYYWVTSDSPIQLRINGKKVILRLVKESMILPFEFVLTRFKMDKDPGTNSPASYESFIRLFSDKGPSNHHVFMNNPLKHAGFTFYQASYSTDGRGSYSSTLSVNYDPGRFWKYLGSLMIVLGSIWHYYLNHRKKKKSPKTTALFKGGLEDHQEASTI